MFGEKWVSISFSAYFAYDTVLSFTVSYTVGEASLLEAFNFFMQQK